MDHKILVLQVSMLPLVTQCFLLQSDLGTAARNLAKIF